MSRPRKVILEDQTLRDGLQFESRILSLREKTELFQLLVSSGFKRIQVGSFVHPKIVPQMADTDELIALVRQTPGVLLTGLVLNEKGLRRAMDCGLTYASMSVSVSDTHSRKNTNQSAEKALESMALLIKEAVATGLKVRAGAQCAFGCVYEGRVPEKTVLNAVGKMAGAGASEVNLADTTGMANPKKVKQLVEMVISNFPEVEISLHLHDTQGFGLVNLLAGYNSGVRLFDVATGGLGGCPFVKGAAGNVPAEDVVNLLNEMDIESGVDLRTLCKAVAMIETMLGHRLPGRICRVLRKNEECQ